MTLCSTPIVNIIISQTILTYNLRINFNKSSNKIFNINFDIIFDIKLFILILFHISSKKHICINICTDKFCIVIVKFSFFAYISLQIMLG